MSYGAFDLFLPRSCCVKFESRETERERERENCLLWPRKPKQDHQSPLKEQQIISLGGGADVMACLTMTNKPPYNPYVLLLLLLLFSTVANNVMYRNATTNHMRTQDV